MTMLDLALASQLLSAHAVNHRRYFRMKHLRLVVALSLAVFGATAMAEAAGKPSWAPPSNPPDTLLTYACSLLPSSALVSKPVNRELFP